MKCLEAKYKYLMFDAIENGESVEGFKERGKVVKVMG